MAETEEKGINIKLTMETQSVSSAIRTIRGHAQQLDKVITALQKNLKFDPNNLQTFSNTMVALSQRMEMQQQIVDGLKLKLKQTEAQYGTNSEASYRLRNTLAKEQTTLETLTAQYQNGATSLDNFNKGQGDLTLNSQNASNQLKETAESFEDAKGKVDSMSVALGQLAAQAVTKAISKLKELSSQIIETGSDYEDAFTGLAAVLQTDVDDSNMQSLNDQFTELAQNSKFSSTEIAENAQVLANAGYSYSQISSALKPIQNLAQGTGEDFSEMANIVADGLHAFGLEAKDATKFSDILAKAAISSNTNVTQMGEAFQYAGTIAGTFSYDVKDVAVALGMMASNGIKGSQAGTALRSIITRLSTDTSNARSTIEELGVQFYDTEGNARPLMDVLDDLREALSGLTVEEQASIEKTVAGQRGMTGLAAIVNASAEDWNNLKNEVADYNGTVQKMSDTRMDTYSGSLAKLTHSWDELKKEIFEQVEPSVTSLFKSLQKLMQSEAFKRNIASEVSKISQTIRNFNNIIEKVGPNLATILDIIGGLIGTLAGTTIVTKATKKTIEAGSAIKDVITGLKTLSTGTSGMLSLLGGAPAVIGLVATAIGLVSTAVKASNDRYLESHPILQQFKTDHQELIEAMDDTKQKFEDSVSAANDEATESQYLVDELQKLVDANGNVKAGYEDRVNYILNNLNSAYGTEGEIIDGRISDYQNLVSTIEDAIEAQKREAMISAASEQQVEAVKNHATAVQQLKDAYAQAHDAAIEYIDEGGVKGITWALDQASQAVYGNKSAWESFAEDKDKIADMLVQYGYIGSKGRESIEAVKDAQSALIDSNQQLVDSSSLVQAAMTGDLDTFATKFAEVSSSVSSSYEGTYTELYALQDSYNAASAQFTQALQNNDTQSAQSWADMCSEIQSEWEQLHDQIGNGDGLQLKVNAEASEMSAREASKSAVEAAAQSAMDESAAQQGNINAAEAAHGEEQATAKHDALIAKQSEYADIENDEASEDGDEISEAYTTSVTDGINDDSPNVAEAGENMGTAVAASTRSAMSYDVARSIGNDWGKGLVKGIEDKLSAARRAAQELADVVVSTTSKGTGQGSPSWIAEGITRDWDLGMINGLKSKMSEVKDTAGKLASMVTTGSSLRRGAEAYQALQGARQVQTIDRSQNDRRVTTVAPVINLYGSGYTQDDAKQIARELDIELGKVF